MRHKQTQAWALALGLVITMSGMQAVHAQQLYRGSATYTREFRDADRYLQTGQYQAAESRYTAALKANPKNTAARSALATAQAELYKLDAAEKNANQVLAKNPKNAAAHMAKGIVYRNRTASLDMTYRSQRGDLLDKSARELQQAVKYDAKSPEIHNQLGETYRQMQRMTEAQREYERALELDPRFAEARLNLGVALMAGGDIQGAKEQFNQAIKLNSKNHMAHYRLGEALLAEGDAHAALNSLNTALSLNRGNAAVMSKMADAYQAQGNTAAAIANYRKAIQASPNFMPPYMAISNIFDQRGDGEMAMAELRSGVNVNPHWSEGRNQLGRLALTVDKPDQALQYYKAAMQDNPNDAEAINGLTQALSMIAAKQANWSQTMGADSDLVNAEQTIQDALKVNPNDMRLHLANLRISQLAGKPAASEAELQRLASMQPQTQNEALIQGEAFLALGRYQDADQVISRMLQQSSGNAGQLLVLGDTLKVNGDLLRAKDAYQAALAAEPGNLKAQRGLDRVVKAQAESEKTLRAAKAINGFGKNRKASSIDYFEDTLSQNPRQPDARLELSKLYEKTQQYEKAARSYQYFLGLRPDLTEKERQGYEKRIAHLQELAVKQTQRPLVQQEDTPLPSTLAPVTVSPASRIEPAAQAR